MNYKVVLRVVVVFVLLMTASGPVLPQDDVRSFEIPNELMITRIRFSYSPQIAHDMAWQWMPALPDIQTPTGPLPECMRIYFQNYSLRDGWVESGQAFYVYPVVTFPDEPYPFAVELANLAGRGARVENVRIESR